MRIEMASLGSARPEQEWEEGHFDEGNAYVDTDGGRHGELGGARCVRVRLVWAERVQWQGRRGCDV